MSLGYEPFSAHKTVTARFWPWLEVTVLKTIRVVPSSLGNGMAPVEGLGVVLVDIVALTHQVSRNFSITPAILTRETRQTRWESELLLGATGISGSWEVAFSCELPSKPYARRCRANVARIRQSGPEPVQGLRVALVDVMPLHCLPFRAEEVHVAPQDPVSHLHRGEGGG